MSNDDLGDRMKFLEGFETSRRFLPGLPIYARIDGRGFSKFTKNMSRPFDERMTAAMVNTTKILVEKTHATIGYCQSDEISLAWIDDRHNWFDGKIMKIASVLGGLASAAFCRAVIKHFPENNVELLEKLPHFDARVISMPSEVEAANMLLWRWLDCSKNSVSMSTRHYYSHKDMQNKSTSEMKQMLLLKNIDWEDYPAYFKYGTWIKKEPTEIEIKEEDVKSIPIQHRPTVGDKVLRSVMKEKDIVNLNKISNLAEVLFNGCVPVYREK